MKRCTADQAKRPGGTNGGSAGGGRAPRRTGEHFDGATGLLAFFDLDAIWDVAKLCTFLNYHRRTLPLFLFVPKDHPVGTDANI